MAATGEEKPLDFEALERQAAGKGKPNSKLAPVNLVIDNVLT